MLKRLLAASLAILATGVVAFAASVAITGTDSEHKNQIFWMGIPRVTRDEAITASTTQSIAGAYQLTAGINQVTVVGSSGDAVKLPITTGPSGGTGIIGGGLQIVIINAGANPMNVYPFQAADTINAIGAGGPFSLANGKTATFFVGNDGKWYVNLSA